MSVLSVDPAQTVLSHSASNSTGLSSAHTENGSQLEEPSPNPSQDNSQGNVSTIGYFSHSCTIGVRYT